MEDKGGENPAALRAVIFDILETGGVNLPHTPANRG